MKVQSSSSIYYYPNRDNSATVPNQNPNFIPPCDSEAERLFLEAVGSQEEVILICVLNNVY